MPMNTDFQPRRSARAVLLCASLAGCGGGGVVDDLLSQCLDLDGPAFVTRSLPDATAGRPYSAVVTAEIVRDPFDEDYVYEFRVNGGLPAGLRIRSFDGQRRVEIFGTPSVAGVYSIRLSVEARNSDLDDPDDASLCWSGAERTYRIVVAAAL